MKALIIKIVVKVFVLNVQNIKFLMNNALKNKMLFNHEYIIIKRIKLEFDFTK